MKTAAATPLSQPMAVSDIALKEAQQLRAEADAAATPAMRERLLRMAQERQNAAQVLPRTSQAARAGDRH
jgi:hypothetical protein